MITVLRSGIVILQRAIARVSAWEDDGNGGLQPSASTRVAKDGLWSLQGNDLLQSSGTTDPEWELDVNGDLQPKA
jgi:hypothetical protein